MNRPRAQFALRLAIAVGAFLLVGRHVIGQGIDAVATDNPYRALWLALPAAIVVSAVRHRYVRRRVHVHDSDLDLLVTIAASMAVFGLLTVFAARLGWAASSLRLEFALAPLVLFTIVSGLFGLRNAMEQIPAFHVVGCAWPFPYVVESTFVPVHALYWVIVATLVAATATALVRWPIRHALPAIGSANAMALMVCSLTSAGYLAVPASLAVVVVFRAFLRRPWAWGGGHRLDRSRPTGWPKKRFGIPFVLSVAFLASLATSSGLEGVAVAPAQEVALGSCPRLPAWHLIAHRVRGGGEDRKAGEWSVGRCDYAATIDGEAQRVRVEVSEPLSWVELGAFPTPTVLAPGGVIDPLTTAVRVGGSDATRFVWHRSNTGGAVVDVSWHVEVEPHRWQRVDVLVATREPPVPFLDGSPGPLSAVLDRVGMVLRTQVAEASRYDVRVPEEEVAVELARQLAAELER